MPAEEVESLIRSFYSYVPRPLTVLPRKPDLIFSSENKQIPYAGRIQNDLLIQAGWSR